MSNLEVVKERSDLHIMNKTDQIPAGFLMSIVNAKHRSVIRVIGGCSGMDAQNIENMINIFKTAFKGYEGVLFSASNRDIKADGSIGYMVTDIPSIVAQDNNGCIAIGSVPRIDTLSIAGDNSTFFLSKNKDEFSGYVLHCDHDSNLIVQDSPADVLEADWALDMDVYFECMKKWQDAGFTIGTITWNGGGISRREVIESAKREFITIVLDGSGRICNAIPEEIQKFGTILSDPKNEESGVELDSTDNIFVVDAFDAKAIRNVLQENGFMSRIQ